MHSPKHCGLKEFADQHGIPFFETSAKDNNNVEQASCCLVMHALLIGCAAVCNSSV